MKLLTALFLSLACIPAPPATTPAQAATSIKATAGQDENFPKIETFRDPNQLAKALANTGLGPLGDWDYVGDYWGASSAEWEFGHEGKKGLKNHLVYHLESTEGNFVKTVKLVLSLPNSAEQKAAFTAFSTVVEQTFRAIKVTMPTGLKTALQNGKPFYHEDSTMIVRNLHGNDYIDSWTLEVTTK